MGKKEIFRSVIKYEKVFFPILNIYNIMTEQSRIPREKIQKCMQNAFYEYERHKREYLRALLCVA